MARCTAELARSAYYRRFPKRRSKLRRLRLLQRKHAPAKVAAKKVASAKGAVRKPCKPKQTSPAERKQSLADSLGRSCKPDAPAKKQKSPAGLEQSSARDPAKKKQKVAPGPDQSGRVGPPKKVEDATTARTDAAALREQLQVRIEEDPFGDCPAPVGRFEDLPALPEFLLSNLRSHGMTRPMPIQAQALPLVLAGRDVIGLAQTGSGKTLAFLLPVSVRTSPNPRDSQGTPAPSVLVLAPTRELAVQIAEEADKVLASRDSGGFRTACIYGGGDKWKQQQKLRWGVDIVVATPGRLLDFIESKVLSLERVSYFVLDEADRMLDLGFQDDVNSIVGGVRKDRQVLFFSATWSADVQKLAMGLCRKGSKPVRISYGQADGSGSAEQEARHQAREGIIQEVVVVDAEGEDHWERQDKEKRAILEKHLRKVLEASPDHKVLVFVSMKQFADEVSAQLQKAGFSADSMHGGKSQEYRLWVLDQFRKGELRLLVCTDVLGRGIDIPSVSHVVVYDMGEVSDYIHRIGRTARGCHGKGHALVFFEYWDGAPNIAAELMDVLAASNQKVPVGLRKIADEVASGKRKVRKGGWSK